MPVPFLATLVLTCGAVFVSPQDPLEQYEFIAGLSRKGLHEQVVREATGFLEEHPGHAKSALVRYHLGGALFEAGEANQTRLARDQYKRLAGLRNFDFAAESALRAGQCELRLGAPGDATAYFKAVRASSAEYLHMPATRLLGEALFEQGDFAAARVHFVQVASKGDAELALDASHGLAWCEFRLGQHEACAATVEKALKRFPKDPLADELRFLRAESLFESGHAAQALTRYLEVGTGAFREASLRGAAFAAAAEGDHLRAASTFELLLRESPQTRFREEALLHRGIHLLEAGEPGQARASLQAAKPTGEGLFWLGRALAAEGRGDQALKVLDDALKLEPGTELRGRIQLARAELLSELGREAEATQAYESAGSDYALHAAAVAKLNAGDPQEAIRLASSIAGRAGPYQLEAQFVLGEGHFALESFGPAEAAFRSVASSAKPDPLKARAASRIGWCRYMQGEHAEAADAFSRVVREFGQSNEAEEALFMEARSREDAQETNAAATSYGRYLAQFPKGARANEASLRLAELEPGEPGLARLEALAAGSAEPKIVRSARKRLAERLSAASEYERAIPHYRALLNGTQDAEARYGLSWCLYSSGDPEAAVRELDPLESREDVTLELRIAALELSVWAARSAGQMEPATASFDSLLRVCDDEERNLRTARVLLEGLRETGAEEAALRVCDSFMRQAKKPEVVLELCVERGHLSLALGQVEDAERLLRAALKGQPQHAGLLELAFFVGEARYGAGKREAALSLFQLAAASPEPQIQARSSYMAGFAQLESGANEAAIVSFSNVVREHSESELYGEALYLLGEVLYREERDAEAIEVLVRHGSEAREHATASKALFRLGLAQTRSSKHEAASRTLSELASRFPDFPSLAESELSRGRSLAALEKPRAARQAFERVLATDKGVLSARARLGLGDLQRVAGKLDEALSEYLKVAVLYAQDEEVAEALYKAGVVLEEQEQPVQARKQYEEIVKEHSKSSFASAAQQRLTRIRQENAE